MEKLKKMWLTDHFKIEEFMSPDTDKLSIGVINNLDELARNLEVLRQHIDSPIHVNSGFRTALHNRKVGGSPNSQHLLGKAADIWVEDYTPKELHLNIEFLIEVGAMEDGGLGLYDTFVHYDVRDSKARWDYRKNK